ncbi:MAG TPA: phosphoribosylanthranilate isomerase [Burkholderiales bacterium]|nr:phosphoribosylanthranilate isomerase [Burkholderiales bacterium]
MHTRIKICGIREVAHAQAAARMGADAVGLVFYEPSPRHVSIERAREIVAALPPFVAAVALFVNPSQAEVARVLEACPVPLLQFHGDETPDFCAGFGVPYLKAARVRPGMDLLEYLASYDSAAGWLLDAYRDDAYGGTGEAFDWNLIPGKLAKPLVLSGGLTPDNVAEAVRRVRPWAVDVSSGVESAKGRKDEQLIAAFIAAVRAGMNHATV